jgi:hypothetical protein
MFMYRYMYLMYVYVYMLHTQASEICGTWNQRCHQLGARIRIDRPGAPHPAPVCARVCVCAKVDLQLCVKIDLLL